MQFNFDSIQKVTKKVDKEVKPKAPNEFQRISCIMEAIIKSVDKLSGEEVIAMFYIGAGQIYGQMEEWPAKINEFYCKLVLILEDPESIIPLENRRKIVVNKIKNKWLNVKGVSFRRR